jgi:putative flavoprotein involved in K+ transport
MDQQIDTLIVGGGQGGLALSYYLTQAGREHEVFEKANQPGEAWRNHRWDSFTLVTPNSAFRLPGAEYDGPDPNGYMKRDDIVARFERYVTEQRLPVRFGVTVESVEPEEGGKGFTVRTSAGAWRARRVAVATGAFQRGKVPPFAAELPGWVMQIESGQYRNPRALPDGAVLVAGCGQSGAQIAEELYQAGRMVYLCVGTAGHGPRRYRGRDLFEWMQLIGFFDRTVAQLPSPRARFASPPLVTGKDGGHALNLHRFYRDGVTLVGHVRGVQDGCLALAADLHESLAKSDRFQAETLQKVDALIAQSGIEAPPQEPLEELKDGYAAPEVTSLDLREAGIGTVIWAMGHSFDFSLVKSPVSDEMGFPVTRGGETQVPGLYFAGLPWMDSMKTGLLVGVGESAQRLAKKMM